MDHYHLEVAPLQEGMGHLFTKVDPKKGGHILSVLKIRIQEMRGFQLSLKYFLSIMTRKL